MTNSAQLTGPALRNVALLACCQALMMSVMSMSIATSPIAALGMISDQSWATLPLFLIQAGVMMTTIPASLAMARIGRRNGFIIGAVLGIVSGLAATWAIFNQSFEAFCVAAFLQGMAVAIAWYYRFAAADAATPETRAKAISFVLVGGVASGTLGPEIGKLAKDLFAPVTFAGVYFTFSILASIVILILLNLRLPAVAIEKNDGGRRLGEIMRQPAYIVAVLSSMSGYGVMTVLMAATPLAMHACGFSYDASTTVIQLHSLAMFLPSFFTGHLINRFGVLTIIGTGAVLQFVCFLIALQGIEYTHFLVANLLVGLGWNFTFIGGSTLLTTTYRPSERAKVQASHDFIVYAMTALAAGVAGVLHAKAGWNAVNILALPFTVIVMAAAAWLTMRWRSQAVQAG